MKTIKTKTGEEVIVDDDDYRLLSQFNWSIHKSPVSEKYNYVYSCKLRIHRIIMGVSFDTSIIIDHINGNVLDNRKCNLRKCTIAENIRNSNKHRDNTSGFKGVFKVKDSRRFYARICHNKETYNLGGFDTAEEASEVYKQMAKKLFGEFYREGNR